MSNPTQELHTERQAPERGTVEKSAVDAILLHCPAVSFPPARMMPVKLMRWKYSMFRWKRLFIIGASATVTHCAVYLGGRGGGGRAGAVSPRETSCWLHMQDFICQFCSSVGAGWAHEIGDTNWRELIMLLVLYRIWLENTVAVCSPNELLWGLSPGWFTNINLYDNVTVFFPKSA